MNRICGIILLTVAAAAPPLRCEAADTLRNPPGTAAPPQTMSNPLSMGATPQPARNAERTDPAIASGGPTRPSKGSDALSAPASNTFGPGGPIGSPGLTSSNTSSGEAGGGGNPGLFNPGGANGGTTPAGLGAARPNGGTPVSGSKDAPMQANGVRKVD